MRTSTMIVLLCLLFGSVGVGDAVASEQATVTTHAGDVYFGAVERSAEAVRLERADGSVMTFPSDVVASVIPLEAADAAVAPAAVAPAAPVAVAPVAPAQRASAPVVRRSAVVRATEPSPPPPALSTSPRPFVRTAAPRVIDVDRGVMAAATSDATRCAEPDPCWESPWTFRGGLALGLGQGNSDFFDVRVDGEVIREPTPWGFKFAFTYVYGERDGESSANNWKALARGERDFAGRNYAFGQVLYERDVLADLIYRWTVTVGVGRKFIDTPTDILKGEVGLGFTVEKRTRREQTVDPSGWLGIDYEHKWSKDCRFTAVYAFRPNFGDFDLSASTLELKYFAPCFEYANFVVGLRLDHVIDPPERDIESLDLLFTVGLTFER